MSFPVVYHPDYSIVWPEKHRFPMTKFAMLHHHLLAEGIIRPEQVVRPRPVSRATLEAVHEPAYLDAFFAGRLDERAVRRTGLGWFPLLVDRTRAEVGGTLLTARLALEQGLACNTAGGTHHAFPDHGSGFCFLNDLAVTARQLLARGLVGRLLIVDLDVHQGDGTAFILRDEPRAFTFSMHGARNFPFRKQTSDLDIALAEGTGDEAYLACLAKVLPDLLDRQRPDLVLYDAGVDPFHGDKLGRLALGEEGLYQRDLMVLRACRQRGLPVAAVIGGGYAPCRDQLARLHALLFRAAAVVWREFN